MAVTLRFGALWATDARRAFAVGAAWATVPPTANGTAAPMAATASRLRQRLLRLEFMPQGTSLCHFSEIRVPWKPAAEPSPSVETSGFASPSHDGFAFVSPTGQRIDRSRLGFRPDQVRLDRRPTDQAPVRQAARCGRRDSTPDALRHRLSGPACLPIPPRPQGRHGTSRLGPHVRVEQRDAAAVRDRDVAMVRLRPAHTHL